MRKIRRETERKIAYTERKMENRQGKSRTYLENPKKQYLNRKNEVKLSKKQDMCGEAEETEKKKEHPLNRREKKRRIKERKKQNS